jgi:hypothetical protein
MLFTKQTKRSEIDSIFSMRNGGPTPCADHPLRRDRIKWGCSMQFTKNRIEHRWGRRLEVNIPVHLEADADDTLPGADGCVRNLSLSGALVQADCHWRPNTLIEVCIRRPPPSERTAVVRAIVSRCLAGGVGIEWYEFAPKVIKELIRCELGSDS